jgi:hypothetical protein
MLCEGSSIPRLANRVQLTSDGHRVYLEAVEGAFGADIDYAMLVKLYGPAPFTGTGGGAEAFATTPEDPEINIDTFTYVERYLPDHCGDNFVAHLTVGLAPLEFLARFEKQPFDSFEFRPAGIAVYQLGNNGTARRALRSWRAAK